ncbi:MAG: hypothetical protein LBV23_00515 [Deltaproteobacteria bacterium]|nr:hypothetical protein [Deltaproteobacteria bacterium]
MCQTKIPEAREGNPVIPVRFKYNPPVVDEVKKLPGRRWNRTLKCRYVPDTHENRSRFGLPTKLPSKRKHEKVSPVNRHAPDKLRIFNRKRRKKVARFQ